MNNTPTQLGTLLCGNAFNKLGSCVADPQSMLVSDSFESFCVGRGFTKAQRDECETAYHIRWRELSNEN